MTSILSKAMRGAATAGAELSMENHRANIQAKRDAKLQQYQSGDRIADQEFRTSERVAGEAHDLKLQKLENEGRVAGGATQGDIQLMDYLQQHGIASSPDDAYNKVREMDTDPQKVIMDIAKSMQAADDEYSRKPFGEYVKIAETEVSSLRERMNPKKPEPAAPTKDNAKPSGKGIIGSSMMVDQGGMIDQAIDSAVASGAAEPKPGVTPPATSSSVGGAVRIKGDEDYKKLASGTQYIGPDGKLRVKK